MKPIHRYLILSIYCIIWVTTFWFAQFFMKCSGFLCVILPLFGVWMLFIASTIIVFLLKPLPIGRVMIRFFIAALVTILCYVPFYQTIGYAHFDYWFHDYALPGILLTVGFSLSWLLPDYVNFKKRKN